MATPAWLHLVEQFAPIIVSAAVPGVGPLLAPIVAGAIQTAEQMAAASGPEKKAKAVELVKAGVQAYNVATPNQPDLNADQIASLAGSAIDTTVQTVNLVHELHAGAGA